MSRFGKTKVENEEFYGAKKLIKISDVNVDNIVALELINAKTNYK